MRFRIKERAERSPVRVRPHPGSPAKAPSSRSVLRAADLDNPYGRYYGTARSREDLRKNR